MTSISIIGSGTWPAPSAPGRSRAATLSRSSGRATAKAASLARELGGGATARAFGAAPAGDIVILTVPYASAVPVVARYGMR